MTGRAERGAEQTRAKVGRAPDAASRSPISTSTSLDEVTTRHVSNPLPFLSPFTELPLELRGAGSAGSMKEHTGGAGWTGHSSLPSSTGSVFTSSRRSGAGGGKRSPRRSAKLRAHGGQRKTTRPHLNCSGARSRYFALPPFTSCDMGREGAGRAGGREVGEGTAPWSHGFGFRVPVPEDRGA